MALEAQDLDLLSKPFPVSAHEFLNGLIYLTEEPIAERLDQVDPNWSFVIKSVVTRPNAGDGGKDVATVTVHASLIIKGVARDGIGMATVQKTNPIAEVKWENNVKKNTGNFYTNEANEAEKSAATDAFKRAARLFSIGRYILTMGKNTVTNEQQLGAWLAKHYPSTEEKPNPLDLDTHLGKAENYTQQWADVVNGLIRPLYDNALHHKNALNAAIAQKIVSADMSTNVAAAEILLHRAQKEYGFSIHDVVEIIGKTPDELVQNKDAFYKVWQLLKKANAEMPL